MAKCQFLEPLFYTPLHALTRLVFVRFYTHINAILVRLHTHCTSRLLNYLFLLGLIVYFFIYRLTASIMSLSLYAVSTKTPIL